MGFFHFFFCGLGRLFALTLDITDITIKVMTPAWPGFNFGLNQLPLQVFCGLLGSVLALFELLMVVLYNGNLFMALPP